MKHDNCRGFTLVEIAIVLVIIGLLLGGVLKGQELINSAKAKNMANDFRAVATMVYSYQDRFRALPGDDPAASAHVGGINATTPAAGLANARINGNWNSPSVRDESVLFWQHVRLANLAAGTTALPASATAAEPYVPKNADGGRLGITGDAVFPGGAWGANFFVCSSNIQGRFARQIDTTIDDGDTTTGAVRVICQNECATTAALPANLTPGEDANAYTLCSAF